MPAIRQIRSPLPGFLCTIRRPGSRVQSWQSQATVSQPALPVALQLPGATLTATAGSPRNPLTGTWRRAEQAWPPPGPAV
jgi:hypothetical protein